MVIYELVANWLTGGAWNGIVSGLVTLFVGMVIWGILYMITLAANVAGKISQTLSDVSRLQQQMPGMYGLDDLFRASDSQEGTQRQGPQGTRVVEGTITDLDEERRKRRYE
ncbi:hypothetical protein KSX_35890 [Ktedonospora formicarum]|uniref:Uncharacterized protein n=2 Tax=Ktedonospora formicarum TaxID=2778364 RepID=A0A8J3HYB3_9CHLR|nr:hypothetical protein KSX_35890 [Ktedonospora formicarum]